MPSISVRRLYQDNQRKLQMSWTAASNRKGYLKAQLQ